MGRTPVPELDLAELLRGAAPPAGVYDHALGNRRHPGAELFSVAQVTVGAECAQEGLLEQVLRLLATDTAHEQAIHAVAVVCIELLEGRNGHDGHHVG